MEQEDKYIKVSSLRKKSSQVLNWQINLVVSTKHQSQC